MRREIVGVAGLLAATLLTSCGGGDNTTGDSSALTALKALLQPDLLKAAAAVLTAGVTVLVGLSQYFGYKTKRHRIEEVGESFRSVVESLGSADPVKRRAAAILLRRFFDKNTEFGGKKTPYAKEAIGVIAATLREEPSGSFQKLLADGLAFALDLRHADLQKTNLDNALLGAKEDRTPDYSNADFFRADLTRASLRGAIAREGAFYQARLHDTVLKGADLRDANFGGADLKGAKFEGAQLDGADFTGARNVPDDVAIHLDGNGKYDSMVERDGASLSRDPDEAPTVFLGKPGSLTAVQQQRLDLLLAQVERHGFKTVELARFEYPKSGALSEVRSRLSGTSGAIIVGLPELQVRDAVWRPGTPDERDLKEFSWSTPWSHIETGMAVGVGVPVLLVTEGGVRGGVFEPDAADSNVYRVNAQVDTESRPFTEVFTSWCAAVRDRAG